MFPADPYRAFFDAIVKGGISPIAEAACRLIGRPIAIGDETGACLFQIPDVQIEQDNWNDLLNNGTIGRSEYLAVHADLARSGVPYNEPVLVRGRFLASGNQVITIFRHHGSILTFATVLYGDDEPTDEEMDVIRVFVQALRPEVTRLRQSERAQEERLEIVLGDSNAASVEYRVASSALEKRYHGYFHILYVEEVDQDGPSVLSRVCRTLNAGLLACVAVVKEPTLAVLVYDLTVNSRTLDNVVGMLENYPVRAGISTRFESIAFIRDYWFQAKTTYLAGRRIDAQGRLYRYDDYIPYQMCAASALIGNVYVFVHPMIRKIAEYDTTNSSNWLDTIESFIVHHLNKGETAKALRVHPNTLSYRLNRIEELFGVDCSDPKFLSMFYTSIMALKFSDVPNEDEV